MDLTDVAPAIWKIVTDRLQDVMPKCSALGYNIRADTQVRPNDYSFRVKKLLRYTNRINT